MSDQAIVNPHAEFTEEPATQPVPLVATPPPADDTPASPATTTYIPEPGASGSSVDSTPKRTRPEPVPVQAEVPPLPRPEWMQPPPNLNQRDRMIWMATEYGRHRDAQLIKDVELPFLTAEARKYNPDEPPFTVKVRAQGLNDMLAAGLIPQALKDEVEDFNTGLVAWTFENEAEQEETDEHYNRRAMAAVIRESGIMDFQQRQKQVRDITICLCSLEPKIRATEYDVQPGELALTSLADKDRAAIYEAIQKATGEVTESEVKSALEESASVEPESDSGVVATGERFTPETE